MALRDSAKARKTTSKASKGKKLGSQAKKRKTNVAPSGPPKDPDAAASPINISPSQAHVPNKPMPKFGYLSSFATIPSLRKQGEQ